nr:hypothetical protein [uncultured Carboxylicivirga sp.]
MNYIKHQTNVFALMDQVTSFKPYHISLYLVLFRMWNANRFENPISISRKETMKRAHIGSNKTYLRTLRDLHHYGFIRYDPSFDSNVGSKVHLYTFDHGACSLPGSKMPPSINNKQTNTLYRENENSNISQNNDDMKNPTSQHPPLRHIQIYFQSKGQPIEEAERFFNYYESNGWLVGGRSKMKDWKAASRNWILNTKRFNSRTSSGPCRSTTSNNQNPHKATEPSRRSSQNTSEGNYSEPL